ncbi:polysaccharide pyruvyl transferase family protein [Ancylobacter sp. 6x-1]|uniref:Polysaccharide pyruvyl transferase family protein n=1 Tax=Ancylobacter crimeensis TaxID=2579147 RepID=A0ABT0D6N9_9HYPH|nr:polysaccharide pyruvyl transferase family protein [Ancylobacter crimeensis]MCK0195604.1 polysaccharide pyruvyl transferase family protein [Ancylobacter crimeensis]
MMAAEQSEASVSRLRVGILTYHFSDNFGALMQAYGLRQWLLNQGVDAEFINYHPSYVEEGGAFRSLFDPAQAKANLKILYLRLSALQRRLFGSKLQAEQFAAFRSEMLGVSGPSLETAEAVDSYLASPAGRFDMLVCGSDQIWNPSPQYGLDKVYFLSFPGGASDARRVAYAPSFGRGHIDAAYADEARRLLGNVDGLSVREASGVGIVESLTGRPAVCVPDPTILLGDFSSLIERARSEDLPEGHVFCYALRTGEGIRQIANLVAERTQTRILSPYNVHRRWKEIGETVYPSPAGWVAMIEKAGFVVTNSFHGTALSILLRKPFLVVGLPGARSGLNERAANLLGSVGLSHRHVAAGDLARAAERLAEPIDWDAVQERLDGLKETGRAYLTSEIEKVRMS